MDLSKINTLTTTWSSEALNFDILFFCRADQVCICVGNKEYWMHCGTYREIRMAIKAFEKGAVYYSCNTEYKTVKADKVGNLYRFIYNFLGKETMLLTEELYLELKEGMKVI